MPSRFQEMLKEKRQNKETSRAGLKWEQQEDDQLFSLISNSTPLKDIALTLCRTEGSIKTRLIIHAINKMEKDNLSLEEASQQVTIPVEEIQEYLEKKAIRAEKKIKAKRNPTKKNRREITNEDIYDMLNDIKNTLQTLLSRH